MTTAGALLGTTIGSYVVRQEIGAGGMGAVYLAEHTMLGRRAALKVLQPELSANQEMVQRFFNEARAASAIKSPGIVEIYDFGYHTDGSAYIVMELLEGETLTARLRRFRALPVPQALVIARQVASALAPAHRAGIIHRDLKPDNIYLVPDAETATGERVKLLDFGIAKLSSDGLGKGMNLTATRTVMGSPQYMSPEQCRGSGVVDSRSDLYALGCILYELLCGRPPFVAEGFGELMGAHLHVAPPPLSQLAPVVPPDVEALVARLLAKDPAQRPQTAEELAARLNELVTQPRPAAATMHVPVPAVGMGHALGHATGPRSAPGSAPVLPAMGTGPQLGAAPSQPTMAAPGSQPLLPAYPNSQLPTVAAPGSRPPVHLGQLTPPHGMGAPGSAPPHLMAGPSPTTMRHASGAVQSPPGARQGRKVAVIVGLVAGGAAAAVVAFALGGKGAAPAAEPGDGTALAASASPSSQSAGATPSSSGAPAAAGVAGAGVAADVAVSAPPSSGAASSASGEPAGAGSAQPEQAAASAVGGSDGSAQPGQSAVVGGSASAGAAAAPAAVAAERAKSEPDSESSSKRSRRKTKAEPASAVVAPVIAPAPQLAETLSGTDLDSGLAQVEGQIRACAGAAGLSGYVYVTIDISPAGKVRAATVTSSPSPKLSACVSSNVVHARFAATQNGGLRRKIFNL